MGVPAMPDSELPRAARGGPRAVPGQLYTALRTDWIGPKYYPFAALTLLVTALVTACYYINHPQPDIFPDTGTYRYVAVQNITLHGWIVDAHRMPGYPMLMAIVYGIAGVNNDGAVSLVQTALFVLAVLEIFAAAYLLLRHAAVACAIALVIGTNIVILSFVKPVLSEGLALWCITSLALALLWFLQWPRARSIWLVTGFLILVFLTRAEWAYAPLLVFGYILFVTARRGRVRRLLPHLLAGFLLCYAVVGGYVYVNATQNNYAGIVDTQNINLFGKVVQYRLQDTAPAQYADITGELDAYLASGGTSSDIFLRAHPELTANHYAVAGAYASAVVKRNVVKFVADSAIIVVTSLGSSYEGSRISPSGLLAKPLSALQSVSVAMYRGTLLFVLCLFIWVALFLWQRTRRSRTLELMGGVMLLAVYDLVMTSAGGFDAYARYHAPFVPLLLLTVFGYLFLGLRDGVPLLRRQPVFVRVVEQIRRASDAADELLLEHRENGTHDEVMEQWRDWMIAMRDVAEIGESATQSADGVNAAPGAGDDPNRTLDTAGGTS